MPTGRLYRWCFTLTNFTEDEYTAIKAKLSVEGVSRYWIIGRGVCEAGTPHLQGYVAFRVRTRFARVKEVVGVRADLESSKRTEEENIEVCSKEGSCEEFGRKATPGKRSDLKRDTTSGIPSSFPRTAPLNAKIHNNTSSSSQANTSTPLTTTPSTFQAARSAFGQTNTTNTATSPIEPDPPHIQCRHTFGSNSSSKGGNKSINRVEDTTTNNNNMKPQLTNAMKQVDTYYKKFLAQEMNMEQQQDDDEVLSRSSTIVTQNDVRDELLERLQHEYLAHTQQITTLQQQLQEEILHKKHVELTFQTEQQRWQTKHDKMQQQCKGERLHDAQRITELETFCQQLQKELKEKQCAEGQGQQHDGVKETVKKKYVCNRTMYLRMGIE